MRYRFIGCLLCLFCNFAAAGWTGVSVTLGESTSDWQFGGEKREARSGWIALQIEEKSASELRIGASIGHSTLRVAASSPLNTQKFDTQFVGVYLRQPIRLSDHISLEGLFSYHYNSGRNNDEMNSFEVDWSETRLQLGLSARFANIRITPFVAYNHVDGDIDSSAGIEIFELDEPQSSGIRFDYLLEPSAFVRFEFQSGANEGGFLSFVRQY